MVRTPYVAGPPIVAGQFVMGLSADADCGQTGVAAVSCVGKKITLTIRSSNFSVNTTAVPALVSSEASCSVQVTVVGAAAPYTATFLDSALTGTNCTAITALIDSGKIVMQAQQFDAATGLAYEKTLTLPVATGFTTGVSMAKTASLSSVITTAGSETVSVTLSGSQIGGQCTTFNLLFQESTSTLTYVISKQAYTTTPNVITKAAHVDTLVQATLTTIPRPVAFASVPATTTWFGLLNARSGFAGLTCEIAGSRYYELFHVNSFTVTSATAATDPATVPSTSAATFDGLYNSINSTTVFQLGTDFYAGEIVSMTISCDIATPVSGTVTAQTTTTIEVIPQVAEVTLNKISMNTVKVFVPSNATGMLALLQGVIAGRTCTLSAVHKSLLVKSTVTLTVAEQPFIQSTTYDKTNYKIQVANLTTVKYPVNPCGTGINFRFTFGANPMIVHLQSFVTLPNSTKVFDINNVMVLTAGVETALTATQKTALETTLVADKAQGLVCVGALSTVTSYKSQVTLNTITLTDDYTNGLAGWAIALIVIGAVIVVAGVGVAIWLILKKK